jgi:hypothetical protein
MDRCRLSTDWQYRGLKALILENRYLRVTILIDHGGRVHEFIYKPSDRDFMYHNPRLEPRTPVYGANVDNWWSGGMDVAIPTGHVCQFRGDELPYLGEVWSLPWAWEVVARGEEHVEVHSWRHTIIAPLLVERWDSLYPGERFLRQRYKVTNVGLSDYPFIWGLHPGFAVNPEFRIDLPAGEVFVEESLPDNRLGGRGTTYRWPYATDKEGRQVDMRQVLPPEAQVCEFHYATELYEGWLALTDAAAREGVALVFPKDIFNVVWMWLVYGGWRDIYTAAVEAWTGYPAKLSAALSEGRYSQLAAGASLECETKLLVFDGVAGVSHISPEGDVTGL